MKIEFRNVSFKYDENFSIENLSFVINDSTSTAIIGPNGSGKSTIVKLIMGLLEINSGSIYINDTLMTKDNQDELRSHFGIIFQNPDNQFVGVTVRDDIAFGLENKQIERNEMINRIDEYSKLLHIEHLLDKNPEELSGGQKQRVAIAGILALKPEVIIFDEATSMLDPIGVSEVNKTLKMLKFEALNQIITITHNIEEIIYFDQVILLNKGKVIKVLKPIELLKDEKLLKENNLKTIPSIELINRLDNKYQDIKDKLWELTLKM